MTNKIFILFFISLFIKNVVFVWLNLLDIRVIYAARKKTGSCVDLPNSNYFLAQDFKTLKSSLVITCWVQPTRLFGGFGWEEILIMYSRCHTIELGNSLRCLVQKKYHFISKWVGGGGRGVVGTKCPESCFILNQWKISTTRTYIIVIFLDYVSDMVCHTWYSSRWRNEQKYRK